MLTVVRRGFEKGFATVIDLISVMAPVYLIVAILGATQAMTYLGKFAAPIMALLGLPGEAATALVVGNALNIYAAIGALGALNLNTKEVTVLALVILISHNLLVETAVSKKTGIKVSALVLLRIVGGFLAGMLLNWWWK